MANCKENTSNESRLDRSTTCENGIDLRRSPNMLDRIGSYEPLNDDAAVTQSQQTFPYPETGDITRAAGQGCKVCVHNKYCEAFYWFRRRGRTAADDHVGLSCADWSESINDQVTFGNEADVNENTRRSIPNPVSPINSEEPTTGSKDSQFNDLGNGPAAP